VDSPGRIYMNPFQNYNWNQPFNQDSLAEWFENFESDSFFYGRPMEIEIRMKEFEKEMEKFKREMDKLKKELRKDTIQVKSKKPVEV